jgi:hypothetical protein
MQNHISAQSRLAQRLTGLAAIAMLSASCANAQSAKEVEHPDTAKWQSLFASDLSDALGAEHWTVKDGELFAKHHNTLWTKKSYGDFVLDLEFKVAKESNSGVFLRSGNIKNVLAALEIQVHEKKDGSKYGMVGAIYDALPPSEKVAKPVGEWNRFTITCKGSLVKLIFNGKLVLDADLDKWPEKGKNPDGTKNKFPKALKDFSRIGPIGFQGLHGKAQAPVWYRNVRIKELK